MKACQLSLPAILSIALLVTACAGRDANPVQIHQSYDKDLSCEQLEAEILSNEQKALALIEDDENAHDANIAIGVVGGLLFWPALFALDTGDAELTEMRALRDRNERLLVVAEGKGCDIEYQRPEPEPQEAEKTDTDIVKGNPNTR